MSKNFIVNLKVYPFDIMFSFGETDELLNKALKKSRVPLDDIKEVIDYTNKRTKLASFQITEKGWSLIRLKNFPKTTKDYSILQHEIFHAVYHILKRIGINLCDDSDEAFSYLTEYITREVYEKLWKA